jgi:hypothetical protein
MFNPSLADLGRPLENPMKISKTTPLEELIPYFAELALSRGLDEQPPTDRQELVARIKELEALPVKNAEGDADGDGSESGTEGDADGDGSESGTEGDADGDGSESGTEGDADGDGSESGTEGDADGDGSESGTEGYADGDGSESGTEGATVDSDVKLVNIKPLCSIRCSHGEQRYEINGNSNSVAVPESLANDLVAGKYAVLL